MIPRRLAAWAFLLSAIACSLLPLRDARACGMFVPSLKVKAPPKMEQERTLIVWDASTRRQHFVREVRFTNTGELPFGFIVPAPSRPEVNDVPSSPFDALETEFPHTLLDTPDAGFGAPGGKGAAEGAGRGIASGGAPPVQVLEKKRVGDFTSFVLAATDAKALADWLKKNQFKASDAGQKWIERYVKLGFFFVALRYEGKKRKKGEPEPLVSRSVRLSYESALPYYPYEEPADAPESRGRELQVWLVTQGFHQPLALVNGSVRRPWSEGARYEASATTLQRVLGELAGFVPSNARVATFGDWKEHRRGFGDLVLVPAEPEGCDLACVNARRPLLAALDASLSGASAVDAAGLVVPPPAPRPAMTRAPDKGPPAIATGSPFGNAMTLGCGIARSGSGSGVAFIAVAGLALARRSRRRSAKLAALAGGALLWAIGCGGPPPTTTPPEPRGPEVAASASAAPTAAVVVDSTPTILVPGKLETHTLPEEPAARQKALMRLFAGHVDDKLIPVWSTPDERGIGHARQLATNALREPSDIEQKCASDPRVEGTLAYAVDSDEAGATRARVTGPLPGPVLACVESVLVSAGPRIGRGVERGFLSLGALGPDTLALRRRIKEEKLISVRPGAVKVKLSGTTVSAGLSRDAVGRVLHVNLARFRFCYERESHPAPKGTVTLKFDIGPGGAVTSMAASAADVSGATGVCMGNTVRTLAFASPGGGRTVKVSATLAFERE